MGVFFKMYESHAIHVYSEISVSAGQILRVVITNELAIGASDPTTFDSLSNRSDNLTLRTCHSFHCKNCTRFLLLILSENFLQY
ncbi:hypothetical protein ANTRET_LOCUS9947 [Anthophora retusa]